MSRSAGLICAIISVIAVAFVVAAIIGDAHP